MKKFQIGLIGAGGIAASHHKGYLAAGAEVVAIAEPFESTRKARETEWNVRSYSDFNQMLQQEKLDAVSVCAPNAVHHAATVAAAARGVHVLCEKPLALSESQMRDMIVTCEKNKVVFQTGHHLRSSLLVETIKKILDSGALGRICFVRLRQAHDWGGAKMVRDNFGKRALSGGGTLLDNGCHLMDLARHLAGNVEEIYARTATLGFEIEVEDTSVVSLQFQSGALGSIENAWTATGWEESFFVYGTNGSIECSNRFDGGLVRHIHRSSPTTDWGNQDKTEYTFLEHDGHPREIARFLDSIQNNSPVICTGLDGLEAVRLVLAAYESSKLNKPIRMAEFIAQ